MDQTLLVIAFLTSAVATDVCTSWASLVQINEFYLERSFSSEVEINLSKLY